MIDINNTNSFFKSNDPCHQLILGIKCASINLKTLHRNIVGKNWYRAHDLLGDFYEKIDEFEDKIVENLMSIGCTDIEIQDNCFLEARPYEADEALRIAKDILCTLLSLSLDVRNQMPLPSPVAAAFDEFENYIQIEANYKLDRYLQGSECCINMPNALVNESLSKKRLKEAYDDYDDGDYDDEEFTIEDGVLIKGPNKAEVIIPDGVTSIGEDAFDHCSNLTSITIPDSVKSIGYAAFNYCENLTSIIIPNSVTSIGSFAFEGCSSLTSITIPDSVTSIGSNAFRWCDNLTSITIGNSVISIGHLAFFECSSLESIVVDENNSEYDSRNNCNAIIEKSSNTLILGCKNTTIPDSVTSIEDWAFHGCESLTSITIPDGVKSIGEGVFSNCYKLTSIIIPNSVTSIEEWAFNSCKSLTSITIPDSVTSIGDGAFSWCINLTSIKYKGKEYDNIDTVINLINSQKINESFFKYFGEFASTNRLNESLDNESLLYHATSFENALKILDTNTLRPAGNYAFNLMHDKKCICFSRSYYFVSNEMTNNEVIFVFDKDKLTNRYHIEPISDSKNSFGHHTARYQDGSKAEELCYTDIDNVNLYIKRIIVDDSLYDVAVENMPGFTIMKKSDM